MTTVVVDVKRMTLVCDSLCTGNTQFITQKLFTLDDGTLIGICGLVNNALKFIEWAKAGYNPKDLPSFSDDSFEAVTVGPRGVHVWDSACVGIPIVDGVFAMGSGSHYARAAVHCGRSIEEAVGVACDLDANSGRPIVSKTYEAPAARAVPRRRAAPKPATKTATRANHVAKKSPAKRK